MSNKTYNNIISLISFLATLGFIICKIIGLISAPWGLVVVPFILAVVFRAGDDEDDGSSNNLKMA